MAHSKSESMGEFYEELKQWVELFNNDDFRDENGFDDFQAAEHISKTMRAFPDCGVTFMSLVKMLERFPDKETWEASSVRDLYVEYMAELDEKNKRNRTKRKVRRATVKELDALKEELAMARVREENLRKEKERARHDRGQFWNKVEAVERHSGSKLSPEETEEFERLERTIEKGIAAFRRVGEALLTIREKKLYRRAHETFEEYCNIRWNLKRRRAYQFIEAAHCVENVQNFAQTKTLPANDSQARELAKIKEPEEQAEVWDEVVIEAEETGEPITAKKVAAKVATRNAPSNETPESQVVDEIKALLHRQNCDLEMALERAGSFSKWDQQSLRRLVWDLNWRVSKTQGLLGRAQEWTSSDPANYEKASEADYYGEQFDLQAERIKLENYVAGVLGSWPEEHRDTAVETLRGIIEKIEEYIGSDLC